MEIFNILDFQHLIKIEKSFANHAEANSGSHSKTSLIGIFNSSEMEVVTTDSNEILIVYIISLIDSPKFHIETFFHNKLTLQTNVDQETFTLTDLIVTNQVQSNDIILSHRPILYIRRFQSWKQDNREYTACHSWTNRYHEDLL